MLRDLGLKTDVQVVDWATVTSRRASKEPVERGGWSAVIPGPGGLDLMDPLRSLPLRANCEKAWFGWPCDAEIERLRMQFADALTDTERKQIARRASGEVDSGRRILVPLVPRKAHGISRIPG